MELELKNILDRVIALYKKYGIKSITMDDVARELGISKKTLYHYVKDKNELVEKAVIHDVDLHHASIYALKQEKRNSIDLLFDVYKYINQTFKEYNSSMDFDLKKYYAEIYRKVFEMRREQFYNLSVESLKQGMKEGYFRKDLDVDIIAKLHLLRMENMSNTDIFSIEDFLTAKVFNEIFNYHIRGIASEKGIKYIEEKLNKEKKD